VTSKQEIWRSVIRGVAYGDAIGYLNEFKPYPELTRLHACGPQPPEVMKISDDTQMTLALARGIDGGLLMGRLHNRDNEEIQAEAMRTNVLYEWRTWYSDPDNNRAPGITTMDSCSQIARDAEWYHATSPTSDTCGAVMRFAPVAFAESGLWQPLSAWQAASTHGGAGAIASSIVATALLRQVTQGGVEPGELLEQAIVLTGTLSPKYFAEWIVDHPLADGSREAAEVIIELGLVLVREQLQQAQSLLPGFLKDPWRGDPSQTLPGWRAHHALACALLCADAIPDSPIMALRRAAVTGGDSDSIACIAGAFIGAMEPGCWPAEWFDRLEPRYRKWIEETEHYTYIKED
jgi:ADP-ribosylglycohydrolase